MISELNQEETDAFLHDIVGVVARHAIRKVLKEHLDMGTVEPPDSVADPSPEEIRESIARSEGKIPDGVTRLPYYGVSYESGEDLARRGILHVDVTESPGGVTRSLPIDVVRYVEIRGFQVFENDHRNWGYVGYFDDHGRQQFLAGFIRMKVAPGTHGFPGLPADEVVHSGATPHPTRTQEALDDLIERTRQTSGKTRTERIKVALDLETLRAKTLQRIADEEMDREAMERLLEDVKNHVPLLPQGTFAAQILDTVTARGSDYGHPSVNHQLTADLWSSWLSRKTGKSLSLSAEDVCLLNILQKLSRLGERSKDDTWLDVMGFSENVSMLLEEQRNRGDGDASTGGASSS